VTAAGFEACRLELGLSVFDLWLAYFTLGGLRSADELDAYLGGDGSSDADHDTLVHALNEVYEDRGRHDHLEYRTV
jgi:hypothetical protein